MELKKSQKIFEDYKCDNPETTIKRVEDGFAKMGLQINYKPTEAIKNNIGVYSGVAEVFKFKTNGKGLTFELAKASAYAEMAERFSCGLFFSNVESPIWTAKSTKEEEVFTKFRSFSYLPGHVYKNLSKEPKAIDQDSDDFFADLKKFVPQKLINDFIDLGFFDSWVDAYSLIEKKNKKVPIEFIRATSTSNGLAAGNTIEESIVHGINEVFERHTALTIIKNKIETPTIDKKTIKNETIKKFIKLFESLNVDIVIKDFSMNGIFPCIGVLFINNNLRTETNGLKKDLFFKRMRVGAHLDKNQALLRCFTEEFQNLTLKEFINREDCDIAWNNWVLKLGKKYKPLLGYLYILISYKYNSDKLSFLEKGKIVPFDNIPDFKTNDCREEIHKLVKICKENGWEILVVDQTNQILNFPAVRIIIHPLSFVFLINDFWGISPEKMTSDDVLYHGNASFAQKIIKYINNINNQSQEQTQDVIKDTEEYIAEYLFETHFNIANRKAHQFNFLAFLSIKLRNYKEALDYFIIGKEMSYHDRRNNNKQLYDIYRQICRFLEEEIIEIPKNRKIFLHFFQKPIQFINQKRWEQFMAGSNNLKICFNFIFSQFQNTCNNCPNKKTCFSKGDTQDNQRLKSIMMTFFK